MPHRTYQQRANSQEKNILLLTNQDVFEIAFQAIPGHNHFVICLALIILHSILVILMSKIL